MYKLNKKPIPTQSLCNFDVDYKIRIGIAYWPRRIPLNVWMRNHSNYRSKKQSQQNSQLKLIKKINNKLRPPQISPTIYQTKQTYYFWKYKINEYSHIKICEKYPK